MKERVKSKILNKEIKPLKKHIKMVEKSLEKKRYYCCEHCDTMFLKANKEWLQKMEQLKSGEKPTMSIRFKECEITPRLIMNVNKKHTRREKRYEDISKQHYLQSQRLLNKKIKVVRAAY